MYANVSCDAYDLGRPRAEIGQRFGVSLATIKRSLKQRREEGHVRPKAIPGRPPKKRALVEANVLPQLQAHDDATLEQHRDLWEQAEARTRKSVNHESSDQAAGLDAKKVVGATERNEEERAAWREKATSLLVDALVFIDETGSNIALTPLYRAPKGERARGSVPRNRGKNTTLIAVLSSSRYGSGLHLGRVSEHHSL